jgi:hypothetical protein
MRFHLAPITPAVDAKTDTQISAIIERREGAPAKASFTQLGADCSAELSASFIDCARTLLLRAKRSDKKEGAHRRSRGLRA